MPQRQVNVLSNIEIDEISFVDRPANQHARISIAKRATEEDTVPEFYDQDSNPIEDVESLEVGSVVYDKDGAAFEVTLDDEPAEHELVGKSLGESVRESLSKAFTDIERDDVIAKAFAETEAANERAAQAEAIAKSERDLRLTREYTEVAKGYGLGNPAELGPVLMRAAEVLSHEDCTVLHKALTSAGEVFAEIGKSGGGSNHDAFGVVEALVSSDTELSKSLSAAGADRHELLSKAFEDSPELYDQYLADRRG